MSVQGRAEPRAKAQRWAGHGGAGFKDGCRLLQWKDCVRVGGRQTQKDLRYHVKELGLYPPGFAGSIEGV